VNRQDAKIANEKRRAPGERGEADQKTAGFSPLVEFDRLNNTRASETQSGGTQPGARGKGNQVNPGRRAIVLPPGRRRIPIQAGVGRQSYPRKLPVASNELRVKAPRATRNSQLGTTYWICWASIVLWASVVIGMLARWRL